MKSEAQDSSASEGEEALPPDPAPSIPGPSRCGDAAARGGAVGCNVASDEHRPKRSHKKRESDNPLDDACRNNRIQKFTTERKHVAVGTCKIYMGKTQDIERPSSWISEECFLPTTPMVDTKPYSVAQKGPIVIVVVIVVVIVAKVVVSEVLYNLNEF